MPSTIAMFTGLTGLKANSRTIDVVGNNIANVNTTAYKSARLNFADLAPWTIRPGSPPAAESGGSNPYQVGLGVRATTTQRNFNSGTIAPTGDPHDLALEGDGFFQVVRDGKTTFTRAGNFRPDANQVMTTPTGERLQGYGVDSNFNIATGTLTDVRIPIGQMSIAQPTTMVTFKGNLNANGALPTTGSVTNLSGTAALGLRTIAGATPSPTGTNLLETTTRLIDIEDPALPASNTPMFAAGQTIQVRGAEKGNKQVPTAALDITSATTIADLNDFLTTTLGIDTTIGNNPDGRTPGVALDPATGILTVIGNAGSVNDLNLASSNVRLLDSAGVSLRQPFVSARSATADGESVRTTFVAYDSLGTPLTLDVSASLV
jgi:flagellar hook protein FlgE